MLDIGDSIEKHSVARTRSYEVPPLTLPTARVSRLCTEESFARMVAHTTFKADDESSFAQAET